MKRIFAGFIIFCSLAALNIHDQIYFGFSETKQYSPDIVYTNYQDVRPASSPQKIVSAFNSLNNQYLLVWHESASLNYVIYAQRISAVNGNKIGEKFQIALPPETGDLVPAHDPSVAYDPVNNRYLVVWSTALAINSQAAGQFIDGASGAKIGNAFLIGNGFGYNKDITRIFVSHTKTFYNHHLKEFVVAWTGRANYNVSNHEAEVEVFAAKVTPAGSVGPAVRVSRYGIDRDAFSRAGNPSIAYDPKTNRYAIVFFGYYQSPIVHSIFANFLDGTSLARLLQKDIVLYEVPLAHITHVSNITNPEIFYNEKNNEYLLTYGSKIIFAERLSTALSSISKTRLNYSGLGYDTEVHGEYAVSYNSSLDQYLFVWRGQRRAAPQEKLSKFYYIYGQIVDGKTGAPVGTKNFRITQKSIGHMGTPHIMAGHSDSYLTSYIVTTKPDQPGFYHNIGGKIFVPFQEQVKFNYDDPSLPKGVKAILKKIDEAPKFAVFKATCKGAPANQAISIKIYASDNTTLEKSKDKILKTKKFQAAKKNKSFKIKLKKKKKMPNFLIAECLSGEHTLSAASAKVYKKASSKKRKIKN